MMRKRFLYTFSAALATVGIALAGCDWQGDADKVATVPVIDAGERLGKVPVTLEGLVPRRPPAVVPDIVFTDEKGREMTLAAFSGEVLVVNLWATWCAPCVREMPALNALSKALEGSGARVVAINQDRAGVAVARPFLNAEGLDALALYLDPKGNVGRALKSGGLPSTYLIGRDGAVLGAMLGVAAWDAPEVVAYLKDLATRDGAAD